MLFESNSCKRRSFHSLNYHTLYLNCHGILGNLPNFKNNQTYLWLCYLRFAVSSSMENVPTPMAESCLDVTAEDIDVDVDDE